jgi:hypothetical protein
MTDYSTSTWAAEHKESRHFAEVSISASAVRPKGDIRTDTEEETR